MFASSTLPSQLRATAARLASSFVRQTSRFQPRLSAVARTASTMAQAIEEAKRLAAQAAVRDHFPNPAPPYVGIGSGTTIIYVVEAIRDLGRDLSNTHFIPTGFQSRQLIMRAGLKVQAYNNLRGEDSITIAFDGADEVDEDLNCIKGGGACLFQEKLVAMRSKQFVCVAGEDGTPGDISCG